MKSENKCCIHNGSAIISILSQINSISRIKEGEVEGEIQKGFVRDGGNTGLL